MKEINAQRTEALFSALAIAVFLILTAWGNATAMLLVSVFGLGVGLLLLSRWTRSRGLRVAVVGLAVAAAVSLVIPLFGNH